MSQSRLSRAGFSPQEFIMKKILIATTALTLMCGSAFAQTTGPGAQPDNMTKTGMNKEATMDKGSMNNGSSTKGATGMSNDGMKRDPNAMPNSDATSHGTVGPGSDSMKK